MRSVYKNRLPIPEADACVRLRKWSCEEREHYWSEVVGQPHATAWVFVHSVADESGERVYSDFDISAISQLSSVMLQRVTKAAIEYNGLFSGMEDREREFRESYEKRFWFLLAGHLHRSVKWCKKNIDVDEFKDWIVYAQHRPIGDDLADFHAAQICHTIVAVVPRRRGKKAPKLSAFLPDWWKPPKKTPEQVADHVFAGFAAMKNSFAKPQPEQRTEERIGDG